MRKRLEFYESALLNPLALLLAGLGLAGLVVAATAASRASLGASPVGGASTASPVEDPPPLKLVQTIRLTNIVANQPEFLAGQELA